jgi:hypothetical protein
LGPPGGCPSVATGNTCSGGVVAAEMNGDATFLVVEDGNEFEAGAECFEILAKRGNSYIVGVLEFGDGSLCDIKATGELCLTDCLSVAEFVKTDLFKYCGALGSEPLGAAWTCLDLSAQFGEVGSGHQISPSSRSSLRYSSYRSSAIGIAMSYQAFLLGVSVEAAIDQTVLEACRGSERLMPYRQVRLSTFGRLHSAGFAVLATFDSPHFTIVLPDLSELTVARLDQSFDDPIPNPARGREG